MKITGFDAGEAFGGCATPTEEIRAVSAVRRQGGWQRRPRPCGGCVRLGRAAGSLRLHL